MQSVGKTLNNLVALRYELWDALFVVPSAPLLPPKITFRLSGIKSKKAGSALVKDLRRNSLLFLLLLGLCNGSLELAD